jgi:hypothetical protein
MEWFRNRLDAKIVIEDWRRHYNEVRPHSSLGYLTPQQAALAPTTGLTTQASFQITVVGKSWAGRQVGQQNRAGWYHRPKPRVLDVPMKARMHEIASTRVRYGFARICADSSRRLAGQSQAGLSVLPGGRLESTQ